MTVTCQTTGSLQRARNGDPSAWEELVRRYRGRLRAIAAGFRLSPCDAEDAMQTTWLDLYRGADRVHSPDAVGAWLATAMRRNCLRILQRQRYEVLAGDTLPIAVDPTVDIEDTLLTTERRRLLWRAAAELPARQAALLRALFADDELSYAEISSALAIPVGAIGPVRQRALRRLAQLLTDAGTPPEDLLRSA